MKNSFRFKWSVKLSVKYWKKVILLPDMLSRYKITDFQFEDKLIWDHSDWLWCFQLEENEITKTRC